MQSTSELSTVDRRRIYNRLTSVVFLKTNESFGGLSNMAGGFPLCVQRTRIYSSEALYQACRFPHLPNVQRLIIEQTSPMTAKMKSKPHRQNSRADWDRVRVKVMRWCLRVKLIQNWERFSELLLRTGDRPIVEESRRDDFWGAKPMADQTLVGMNVLGRLLMELREAVRSQGRQGFRRLDPPDIVEFLLFSQPIGVLGDEQPVTLVSAPERSSIHDSAEQASLFEAPGLRESATPVYAAESAMERDLMRTTRPYPSMKDSGVTWWGEVPEHWQMRKLRSLLRRVTERNRPDLPLLSVVREKGVTRRGASDDDDNHNFVPDDLSNYKVVRPRQFAMNKMKAWQGSYGVSHHEGIVSPAYFVFDLCGVEGQFFHTALRSRAYVPFFTKASDGVRIGQWDLSEPRMREIPFVIPPAPEQAAIVRFLDHVDRRIRDYIRTKQKLIKLLEEQQQAIIHCTLTRGLDPNVRLKPSGVEWLGDVPEHWDMRRLRSLARVKTGERDTKDRVDGGEFPFFVRSQVVERIDSWSFDGEAVLTAGDGNGGVGKVFHYVNGKFDYHQRVYKFSHFKDVLGKFFFEYLRATLKFEALAGNSRSTVNLSLRQPMLLDFPCVLPPINEQAAIVEYLGKATAKLKTIIARAEREIELLREYRTCLIADVVTGKLDVRDAAARLPDLIEDSELSDDLDPEPAVGDSETSETAAGQTEA